MAKILVVDDHPTNREYLLTLLGYTGHLLLEAENGPKALEVVRAEHPDLVITDLLMPTMDGYEFVRQLRAEPALAQTRVIFFTATYLESETRTLAQALGVSHVMSKPIEAEVVLKIVAEVLALAPPSPHPIAPEEFRLEHRRVLTNKLTKQVADLEREVAARKRMEAILTERARLAALGADVGSALAQEENLRMVLQRCTEAMVQHLDAAFARIWTLNRAEAVLELQASAGLYTHLDGPHSRVPVGHLKIGLIAQERKPHLTNAVIGDPRVGDQEWAKREGMVAFAGYPLVVEDRLVGVIAMFARQHLTDFTLAALAALADRVALGINYKQAVEALRRSEAQFRATFIGAGIGMGIADMKGSIIEGNSAFHEMFGYRQGELTGKVFPELTHPDDKERSRALFAELRGGKRERYQLEKRYLHRDGHVVWGHLTVSRVQEARGGQHLAIVTIEDITARKQKEEENRKLHDQLFQAQKLEALGTLAGGIAHDFNNILTIILGFSELLKEAVLDDAVAQGNLEEVQKAGYRAKELVQQLLAFSRPDQQARSPVALNLVVAEALRLLRAVLPTTIEIRSSLDPAGAVILANATQLHQIIMNLSVNALYAMQEKGGVLEVRVEPTIVTSAFAHIHPPLTPGAYCQLTVRDTGCGMTPAVMTRIFDPFFTTKPTGEGSGLGLSVIQGIVRGYGGTITVASTPGQGSAFAIYFPQHTEAVASTAPVALPTRRKSGRVVLFVDDEQAVAHMAQQMLERLGYEAVVMTSSQEALDIFRHRPGHFDVVVTDQTMPGLTGDQLAQELLALRPEVPIILCTGFSPTLTEEKARALGIRTYLRKPLSSAELGRALEDIFISREEA